MHSLRVLAWTLSVGSLCGLSISAHADPVITFIGTTTVGQGATAPGSPSDYAFFGGEQPVHLTNFNVSTYDDTFPGNPGYSTITAPDGNGPFRTGTEYNNNNPLTEILASFTSNSASSFTVYILNGNADLPFVEDSTIGLGVNGGAAVNSAALQAFNTNQFNIYTVSGATPGDVFSLYVTADTGVTGAETNVGGITFSTTSPVPEPSSLALLGTGLLGALGAARRKLLKP